jgi:hypothetical protein
MAGRPSRVRRPGFLLALLVSAALYAYSLVGIAGTGNDLRSAVRAEAVDRSINVSYRQPSQDHGDCPARDDADPPRVRL